MTAEGMINAFRGDRALLRWQKKGVGKGGILSPLHRGRRFFLLGGFLLFMFFAFGGDRGSFFPYSRGYKGGVAIFKKIPPFHPHLSPLPSSKREMREKRKQFARVAISSCRHPEGN